MRILLVKTSSLGDVIHNLPVATDLQRAFPEAQIDWCVEAPFAALPRLHPAIDTVIPVALRQWRKHMLQRQTWQAIGACRAALAAAPYDAILDTQGLLKSALIARQAHGARYGYDHDSAREPLASLAYHRRFSIDRQQHAVQRNRQLAAAAFGYACPEHCDYGIYAEPLRADWLPATPYAVLLTATSRDDKLWPEADWLTLGRALNALGLQLVLPSGSAAERQRAERLARQLPGAVAAPSLDLNALAGLMAGARLVVGVDTGLSHLAAALQRPTIALYTATDPGLTGVFGSGPLANLGGKAASPRPEQVLAEAARLLAESTR